MHVKDSPSHSLNTLWNEQWPKQNFHLQTENWLYRRSSLEFCWIYDLDGNRSEFPWIDSHEPASQLSSYFFHKIAWKQDFSLFFPVFFCLGKCNFTKINSRGMNLSCWFAKFNSIKTREITNGLIREISGSEIFWH